MSYGGLGSSDSLTAPFKLMGGGVTISLSLKKRNLVEVRPLVKMSAH
jgi:hypothetical protein